MEHDVIRTLELTEGHKQAMAEIKAASKANNETLRVCIENHRSRVQELDQSQRAFFEEAARLFDTTIEAIEAEGNMLMCDTRGDKALVSIIKPKKKEHTHARPATAQEAKPS